LPKNESVRDQPRHTNWGQACSRREEVKNRKDRKRSLSEKLSKIAAYKGVKKRRRNIEKCS
jgi:hypothetical protein